MATPNSKKQFPTVLVTVVIVMATAIPCVRTLTNDDDPDAVNRCPQDTETEAKAPPMYYSHPGDCNKFYECVNGNPQVRSCCPGAVFNDQMDVCVTPGSMEDNCTRYYPTRECLNGLVDLIPHPEACQRYFNCSDTLRRDVTSKFQRFEQECHYPQVFDIFKRKCVHYEGATCGEGRVAATWSCDYLRNQCPVSHCIPCSVNTPSCVGKADGTWPHPERLWSPYFIECKSERTGNTVYCPVYKLPNYNMTQLYHPDDRRCKPLWDIPTERNGYQPSCKDKPPGYHTVEGMEFIAYRCPGRSYFYCYPPLHVHSDITQCQPLDV